MACDCCTFNKSGFPITPIDDDGDGKGIDYEKSNGQIRLVWYDKTNIEMSTPAYYCLVCGRKF